MELLPSVLGTSLLGGVSRGLGSGERWVLAFVLVHAEESDAFSGQLEVLAPTGKGCC